VLRRAGTYGCVQSQRGASLLETVVVVAFGGAAIVAAAALRGAGPPRAHLAALAFEGAVAEARAVAAGNANAAAPGAPGSGATLVVAPSGGETVLTVYRARPIAGAAPPELDPGYPPQRIRASFAIEGKTAPGEPFTILISSSGYASVAGGYAYDPLHPVMLDADPGCEERAGVAIAIGAGAAAETHPFDCRRAHYDAAPSPATTG